MFLSLYSKPHHHSSKPIFPALYSIRKTTITFLLFLSGELGTEASISDNYRCYRALSPKQKTISFPSGFRQRRCVPGEAKIPPAMQQLPRRTTLHFPATSSRFRLHPRISFSVSLSSPIGRQDCLVGNPNYC